MSMGIRITLYLPTIQIILQHRGDNVQLLRATPDSARVTFSDIVTNGYSRYVVYNSIQLAFPNVASWKRRTRTMFINTMR